MATIISFSLIALNTLTVHKNTFKRIVITEAICRFAKTYIDFNVNWSKLYSYQKIIGKEPSTLCIQSWLLFLLHSKRACRSLSIGRTLQPVDPHDRKWDHK